jgi:macrodomain Ter protein organizer (MatP/YcbG family)
MVTEKPKRKTAYVPDSQRHTKRVTLRLDPKVADRLHALAVKRSATIAEVVTDAIAALEGKKR